MGKPSQPENKTPVRCASGTQVETERFESASAPALPDIYVKMPGYLRGFDYHEYGLKEKGAAYEGECVSKLIGAEITGGLLQGMKSPHSPEVMYDLMFQPLGISCAKALENGAKNEGAVRMYPFGRVSLGKGLTQEKTLLVMNIPSYMVACAAYSYSPINRGTLPDNEHLAKLWEETRKTVSAGDWRGRFDSARKKIAAERNGDGSRAL